MFQIEEGQTLAYLLWDRRTRPTGGQIRDTWQIGPILHVYQSPKVVTYIPLVLASSWVRSLSSLCIWNKARNITFCLGCRVTVTNCVKSLLFQNLAPQAEHKSLTATTQ